MNESKRNLSFPGLFAALLLTLFLPACEREEDAAGVVPEAITYQIGASLPEPQTRSDAISAADADAQRGIYVAVYSHGRRLFAGAAPLTVTLVSTNRYNLYAWTAGALARSNAPEQESALIDWEALYPGLQSAAGDDGGEALASFVSSYGVPMAGSLLGITPESTVFAGKSEIRIPLQRLFASLRVRVDYDDSMSELLPQRSFLRLRACNWAYACHPFDSGSFDPSKVRSGAALDIATTAESNGSYLVYVPENLQGILDEGNPARCTYLEAAFSFGDAGSDGPGGAGGGIGSGIYRFYPQSYDEYNIRRNTSYDISLHLSYDGRFVTGQWQSDGDTGERRTLSFDPALSQALSPPGSDCYSTLRYGYGGSGNYIEAYFKRFNGVAVGTEAEINAWIADGTKPASTRIERVGRLRCTTCGSSWWGYPETPSERIGWARSVLTTGSGNYLYCPACHSILVPGNSSGQNQLIGGGSGATAYEIDLPAPRIVYRVPANATVGQVIRLHAATRDGRISCIHSFTVGDDSVLLFNEPVSGTQYVAQQCDFAPVSVPADITSLSYAVSSGSDCVEIVPLPGSPQGRRIRFKKSGDVTILVRDQNGTLRQTLTRSVLLPSLGFLDTGGESVVSEYRLHPNGSAITPRPAYFKADGSRYEDYDATLYGSCLGDPTLSVSSAWAGCSGGDIYVNRIFDESLGQLPYRGDPIGSLIAHCPLQSGLPDASVTLRSVNPFSGWPATPLSCTVDYAWNESLKKDASLPCYFNAQMQLIPRISPVMPLVSHSQRGMAALSFSEQEARDAVPCAPTVNKYPGNTSYCGQVRNTRSGEILEQTLFNLTVNVEMRLKLGFRLFEENASQKIWRISLERQHTSGTAPMEEDLGRVYPTSGRVNIYPSGSKVTSGSGVLWYRATYDYNTPGGSYNLIMDVIHPTVAGPQATADTAFFKQSNAPQFTRPYLQSDGYSYVRPGETPLSAPASDGVWKLRLDPLDW